MKSEFSLSRGKTPLGGTSSVKTINMMGGVARALRHFCGEITVEPVLFLYMLSTFSQYALFQDLVYSKVCWSRFSHEICSDLHSEEWKEELEIVQADSSFWILMSTVSLVLPSILISIYLGSWSDQFGRKWPVVFPPLGGILACLVYIVLSFDPSVPVHWICLASALSGLSGGFVSCIMSCMTYVASVSSQENRTLRISRLEGMIFLGGTIGPFLSGSLLQITTHGYVFIVMLISYAAAFTYAILFVKEVKEEGGLGSSRSATLHRPPSECLQGEGSEQRAKLLIPPHLNVTLEKEVRVVDGVLDHNYIRESGRAPSVDPHEDSNSTVTSASSDDEHRNILHENIEEGEGEERTVHNSRGCSRYFGLEHFLSAVKTVLKRREGGRRALLILIIIAGYITMMITAGELDVAYLFARGEPLKWSYQIFSYYFGFKYGIGSLLLLIAMPAIQRLQIEDTTICLLGLVSRMGGLVLYAFSPNTTFAFFAPVVGSLSFLTIPATRSLLSKLVQPHEQGKMFAFVAIIEDLCTMSASVLFNSVYPLTRPIFSGFIFLLAAVLLLIPLFIMLFVRVRLSRLDEFHSVCSASPTPTISSTLTDTQSKGEYIQEPQRPYC